MSLIGRPQQTGHDFWFWCLLAVILGTPQSFGQVIGAPRAKPAATATKSSSGQVDYLAGLGALEQGHGADAITALTAAIQADSENADYFVARGVANILSEKLPAAIKDLERAQRLRPDHKKTKLWLAVAVGMTGDFFRDSTIYPFATNDLDESFVRQASHDYGEVAFRQPRNEVNDEMLAKREVAKRNIAQSVALFATQAQSQPGMEQALFARAKELFQKQDYAGAIVQLDRVLAAAPEDFDAMFYHAMAALKLGDFATARTELTRVLTAHTDWVPAYLARSLASAQLGDVRRAKADLSTATRLDPKAAAAERSEIERQIAAQAITGGMPKFAELDELAHAKLSTEDRDRQALRLAKLSNNSRRRYDENYQDRLRELEESLRAMPKDPSRMVALGQFLLDEASVRRERVEPRAPYRKFRYQTANMESQEVTRAEELADQALAVNAKHVDALCLKASARYWDEKYADAESLVRKALALDAQSPRVLELFSKVLEVAAIQKSAEAASLRRPTYLGSHDEHVGDYIYTYTRWRYPSQAELEQAQQLDQQSQELVNLALEQIQAAARFSKGKPEGFQLQGLYHWRQGELEEAAQQFELAVKAAPNQVQWHYNLAALYEALGRSDESFQTRLVAVNLIETTAGPLLAGTWDLVNKTKFRSAREALTRSGDIDVADSRVAAYLGVVAAAEEQLQQAVEWFQTALALERARLQLSGKPLAADAQGSLAPDDYGLYLGVARRLAQTYLKMEQPEAARNLLLACLPLAKRVSRRDLSTDVSSALLPDPELDPQVVPEAENVLSLFAWLQVTAGEAMVALRENDDAIGILSPVETFTSLMQNGVGANRLRGPTLYASLYLARAYLAKGDMQNAQRYAMQLPRKRHGVGPSLGPFPELEEEGSRLQEEIAGRRSGARAEGSETSDEFAPADEDKVNQALQKIGAEIGHPELGNGSLRFTGDASEAGLCVAVSRAVGLIVAPKSTRWRSETLAGIAMVQTSRQQAQQRADAMRGRTQRAARNDSRNNRQPQNGGNANPADILARFDKAVELLKELAIDSGYPKADLERDLQRSPAERLRLGR